MQLRLLDLNSLLCCTFFNYVWVNKHKRPATLIVTCTVFSILCISILIQMAEHEVARNWFCWTSWFSPPWKRFSTRILVQCLFDYSPSLPLCSQINKPQRSYYLISQKYCTCHWEKAKLSLILILKRLLFLKLMHMHYG